MACSSWYSVASTRSSASRSPSRAAPPRRRQYSPNSRPKCDVVHVLPLTVPAPDAGALADHPVAKRPPAAAAGLVLPSVDRQFLLEVPRRAVGIDVVAQGRAAARDGLSKDRADGLGESRVARTRERSSLRSGAMPAANSAS